MTTTNHESEEGSRMTRFGNMSLGELIAAENEYRRRLDEAIAEDDKAWEFADAD